MQVYKTLSLSLPSQEQSISRDSEFPATYFILHGDNDEGHCAARTRFVHPSNFELISLRLTLLKRKVSSFQDGRMLERPVHSMFRSAAVAMGLYAGGKIKMNWKSYLMKLQVFIQLQQVQNRFQYVFIEVELELAKRMRRMNLTCILTFMSQQQEERLQICCVVSFILLICIEAVFCETIPFSKTIPVPL